MANNHLLAALPERADLLELVLEGRGTPMDRPELTRLVNSSWLEAEETSRRLSSIVESSSDAIYGCDLDGIVTSWNRGAVALYGYTAHELVGRNVSILYPDGELAAARAVLERARSGQRFEAPDTVRRRRDGDLVEVSLVVSPVFDVSGRLVGSAAIVREITERKVLERALALDRNRLAAAQRLGKLGSFEFDPLTGEHAWSAELFRILGVATTARPDDDAFLAAVHRDDRAAFTKARRVAVRDERPLQIEHRIEFGDGTLRWVLSRAERTSDGKIVGAVQDITERKQAEEAMVYQSRHDKLTGFPNRTVIEQCLGAVVSGCTNNSAAVMMLDVDRFKVINDAMGHGAGDQLLVAIAERLGRWALPTDTVCRFGGDEFVLVCEQIGTMHDAYVRAVELLELFDRPFAIGERQLHITVSIGLTSVPDGAAVGDVLRDADAAMYCAKNGGRRQVAVADDSTRERAASRLESETELRLALERDEFCLHYQPVVDLEGEQILGYEALIRWQHPVRGLIHPDEFIALAEETGLIVPIGRWVLLTALAQLAAWRTQATGMDHTFIAVNVSTVQLYSSDIAHDVEAKLAATGIDADSLHLEITETALMDIDRAAATIESLTRIGVHIELDDFGTGYSSMSYLQKLPIDTIKIDRSFTADLDRPGQQASIVDAIIRLGQALGIRVLAEGVETIAQRDHLRGLGCNRAQGYLWSRPMPAERVPGYHASMTSAPCSTTGS